MSDRPAAPPAVDLATLSQAAAYLYRAGEYALAEAVVAAIRQLRAT